MSQADDDAIREIEAQFDVPWNRHDPDAIGASLADDAQSITVNGAWTASCQGFRDLMQRMQARTARTGRARVARPRSK